MIKVVDQYGNEKVTTSPVTVITGNLNQKEITIKQPTGSEKIAIFYTTIALTISNIRAIVNGISPSVTYNVVFGSDMGAAGTNATTSPVPVTNTTTGVDAVLDNVSIPAGSWVWVITTSVSGTVNWINVTIWF